MGSRSKHSVPKLPNIKLLAGMHSADRGRTSYSTLNDVLDLVCEG